MQKEPQIRKARIGDFLDVARLDRNSWQENRDSDYIPDGEHIWRLWIEYSTVFVALIDNRIIGASVMFKSDEGCLFLLHKIFIEKEFRDKKIGHLFFSKITEFLDQCQGDCLLTTDPVNARMIHLCEKFGFLEKTFEPSFYRENEDRYILRRVNKKGLSQ